MLSFVNGDVQLADVTLRRIIQAIYASQDYVASNREHSSEHGAAKAVSETNDAIIQCMH